MQEVKALPMMKKEAFQAPVEARRGTLPL